MSFAVPGFGTRFYRKARLQRRTGVCESCQREAPLESYDATQWFVLLFVPLVPLGRKRILDHCPVCRQHTAADLATWERESQLTISGARADYEVEPSAERAIRYHQSLLDYQELDEAKRLQRDLERSYAADAHVQAHLGQTTLKLGDSHAADKFFERAFKLQPELPAAREGMALRRMRAGDLKGADELLSHLHSPGKVTTSGLRVIEALAHQFQQRGMNREALSQFAILLREQPQRAQDRHFRASVHRSEQVANTSQEPSLLPRLRISPAWVWRNYQLPSLVLLSVLSISTIKTISSALRVRHQVIHVVNGFPLPASLRIDNQPAFQVPNGHLTFTLAEGRHLAHVSGPVSEEIAFELRSGIWNPPPPGEVPVLNLGGHAILMKRRVQSSSADELEFSTGRRFLIEHDIDHAFEPLPSKADSTLAHTALELFQGRSADVIGYYMQRDQPERAMSFCEGALIADGECDDAAELYPQIAAARKMHERAIRFLQPLLSVRPVQIPVHRAWQDVRRVRESAAVLAEYQKQTAQEPQDAALAYLLGRILDGEAQQAAFRRATELDQTLSWAWFAQGIGYSARGEWKQALPLFEKAAVLRPGNSRFVQKRDEALIGAGKWEQIKRDALARIKISPNHFASHVAWVEAEAALGSAKDAERIADAYVRNNSTPGALREDLETLRTFASYAGGGFKHMIEQAGVISSPAHQRARFQARVELGEMAEAVAEPFMQGASLGFADALAAALGWKTTGDETQAAVWEKAAISSLGKSGEAAASLVNALTSTTPPRIESMNFTGLEAQDQSLVYAWLAKKFPAQREPYADMARRFNIRMVFPHHLVKKTVGSSD